MRCAIYARYSTDRQRETSIDDQVRVCRARVEPSWSVIIFADDSISGSTPVALRRGGSALLSASFDILMLEGLDRLSRDLVEQERIVRRLEYRGIRIIGVSDGYDSQFAARKLHRGMRGLINEAYLDDLRAKVHRGLAGQYERGFFAGGLPYGYRSVDAGNGRRLEIDPDQAERVRWIYQRYADGWSCQRIAKELNRLAVPSPRGTTWAVSALYGAPRKGTGILTNELYAGRYIWNRSMWMKDPDTGTRKRLERPRAEWKVTDMPDLRIVHDPLWRAVQARRAAKVTEGGMAGRGARPRTLLGGILRCGVCGGAVTAVNRRLYGCVAHKDRGTCVGVYAPRGQTEARLLAGVRDELLSPSALAQVQTEVRRLMAEREKSAESTQARAFDLDRQIRNLTEAVAEAGWSSALSERLRALENERAGLDIVPVRKEIPGVLARYRRLVADLHGSLTRDTETARIALHELLGEVRIINEGTEVWAEIETRAERLLMASGAEFPGLVAGVRYRTRIRIL